MHALDLSCDTTYCFSIDTITLARAEGLATQLEQDTLIRDGWSLLRHNLSPMRDPTPSGCWAQVFPPLLTEFKTAETPQDDVLTGFGNHPANEIANDDRFILYPWLHHQDLLTKLFLEFTVDKVLALLCRNTSQRWVL